MAIEQSRLLWPVRPKQHMMEHLRFGARLFCVYAALRILDFMYFENPRESQCMLDEDMMRRVFRLIRARGTAS